MRYDHTDLCQLGPFSCMGCCGNRFGSRESLEQGIHKNTLEFSMVEQGQMEHHVFRDRRGKDVLSCGACPNLVFDPHKVPTQRELAQGKDHRRVVCSIHPKRVRHVPAHAPDSSGDLREGFCDILHVCKTAYQYERWDDATKKKFLTFLRSRGLDWHSYSLGMASGKLLDEFSKMQ